MLRFIERHLTRALAYLIFKSLTRHIDPRKGLREMIDRELAAIRETLVAFNNYQVDESDILTARLGRRYDPGMALNEATQRALKDKETARRAEEVKLTGNQLAALEIQKQYLKRVVDRS